MVGRYGDAPASGGAPPILRHWETHISALCNCKKINKTNNKELKNDKNFDGVAISMKLLVLFNFVKFRGKAWPVLYKSFWKMETAKHTTLKTANI